MWYFRVSRQPGSNTSNNFSNEWRLCMLVSDSYCRYKLVNAHVYHWGEAEIKNISIEKTSGNLESCCPEHKENPRPVMSLLDTMTHHTHVHTHAFTVPFLEVWWILYLQLENLCDPFIFSSQWQKEKRGGEPMTQRLPTEQQNNSSDGQAYSPISKLPSMTPIR